MSLMTPKKGTSSAMNHTNSAAAAPVGQGASYVTGKLERWRESGDNEEFRELQHTD